MARGKKKDPAPAPEATETTTAPQEGQEPVPAQEQPSAQQGQDNTPQAQEGQESGQEAQEGHLDPGQFQDMDDATLQGLAQDLGLDPAAYEDRDSLIAAIAAVPVVPGPPEAEDPEPEQQDPAPAPEDTDPAPAGERPLPYKGTVAVSLAVLHKAVGVGTADMLKVVGTLRQGTEVTVTGRNGPFAQLKNGLWMKESFLEA